ncbi:MAG: hypothetical protein WAK91_05030 [Candidatus Acidiferrales bacterium]|jgi:hypothetical protein
MLSARTSFAKDQTVIGLGLLVLGLAFAWEIANWIAGGKVDELIYVFLAAIVCVIGTVIFQDWRTGFYLFLFWVVFEDLVRKYMGNNMAIYFGKDALVVLIYVSLFISIRRHRDQIFRPEFAVPLVIFFWFAVVQAFNPYSASPLYGALGLKVDFLYAGLMFVGYALIRTDDDLRRFLTTSMILAAAVSILGIIQSIVGPQFLNPATLAPEIKELAALQKVTPISHEIIHLPSAVFVSASRYSSFMSLAVVLGLGASGYLLLHTMRGRWIVWGSLGIVAVGVLFSGSRGSLIQSTVSAVVMGSAFIWGAPWRTRQVYRMLKALRQSAIVTGICIALAALVYPIAVGGKWAYYTETLSPDSESYQLSDRVWDYPIYNLELAFAGPHWMTGIGTGTTSLGAQYVARFLKQKPGNLGVECGYGTIVVEFGIFGLILWLAWTSTLMLSCWRTVLKLRQTRMFPIGFMVFWFAFVLLFPQTFASMNNYQDYVENAYLWLLVGILFRLPEMIAAGPVPVAVSHEPRRFSR